MLAGMFTNIAQSFFGGRRIDLAKALEGDWSASAVYLWKGIVPLAAARKLEKITEGKLRVIEELYDERGNIVSANDKILPAKKHKSKRRRAA
jgi:hypothetical protein